LPNQTLVVGQQDYSASHLRKLES